MMRIAPWRLPAIALLLVLGGCATRQPYDYSNYRAHPPRSILVLPPLNESTTVEATYSYLSTVTQPLAELGYYVFPVAVIDQYLKANGMPTPGEMHQIPLSKVAEIIGADAVLYVDVKRYGSKFELISSNAVVTVAAKLVDTRSATLLWEGSATAQNNSNSSGGNFLAELIAAAIVQVASSKMDVSHGVCRLANAQLFNPESRGLPYGPYNPKYGEFPR
jgi:hypothetical protein